MTIIGKEGVVKVELVQQAFGGVSSVRFCEICGRPLSNPTSIAAGMGPICRGKGHSQEHTEKPVDVSEWGSRFDFVAPNGAKSWCYILIKGNTVIATDPGEDSGMSITNAAEELATAICYKYHIPLAGLVWFEHYHADREEETFDRVSFSVNSGKLTNAQWKASTRAEAMGSIA